MIKELIKIANELDSCGLIKEAEYLDSLTKDLGLDKIEFKTPTFGFADTATKQCREDVPNHYCAVWVEYMKQYRKDEYKPEWELVYDCVATDIQDECVRDLDRMEKEDNRPGAADAIRKSLKKKRVPRRSKKVT